MDRDYEPMDYEEQNVDQPAEEDDSDELINEQADEDDYQEEPDDSKETEEEEVRSARTAVSCGHSTTGRSCCKLLWLRRMRPLWLQWQSKRKKGSSSSRCRRNS